MRRNFHYSWNLFCHICTLLFQGVREAVKNARKWAKQAFRRLEARVLRPDKEKVELEPGVRGQEGEEGVREEYLYRLSQD